MPKLLNHLNKIILIAIVVIAIIGLIDASYLTITHYTKALVPCNFTHACETVLQSSYSTIFGVPVAAFGVIFYIVTLIMAVHFFSTKTYHVSLSVWGLIGFGSTLYLLFVQAFILQAWCQYCLLSALTSILIFICTTVLYFKNKHKDKAHE